MENCFEIADGEVEVVGVGAGVEVVAVGARVEAGEDGAAAIEVMAAGGTRVPRLAEQIAVKRLSADSMSETGRMTR